ncbi:MAG: phosphatidylglycerophosphatase A [Candidatus Omnitrophota bacterium]
MKNIIKFIASFGYLGYVPFIPGTAGSLGALVLYLLCQGNFFVHTAALLVITLAGFLVCAPAEKLFARKDAAQIVIDEAAGIFLAFWAVPVDNTLIAVGFVIFRALDAAKVFPVNKMEKLPGALGIMGDDLLAAGYTNIVLQIVTRVFLRMG